jgi:hypothetical protein
MKKLSILLILALFASTVFAASALSNMTLAIKDLCRGLRELLPVAAMMMIILAGVLYAAGQMMGAETRARSNVWATAALTGALIAILIVVIAPPVLDMIYSGSAGGNLNATICS